MTTQALDWLKASATDCQVMALHFGIILQEAALDQVLYTKKYHVFAPMGRPVRINLPLFSTVVSAIIYVFLSCRPFVAITTLSTGLVGVEVTSVSSDFNTHKTC